MALRSLVGGRKASEKCGGFLRGHGSRGREGNEEKGCGFGCVEDAGICFYKMGWIWGQSVPRSGF